MAEDGRRDDGWRLRRPAVRKVLASALSVAVFAGALLILHLTLGRFDVDEVAAAARSYPAGRLLAALALAAGSYATLCGFDWLALRHQRRGMPLGLSSLVSFTSHAISHNAGFAILTGGSVRLRMYSAFGLSMAEVAGVVAFAGLSFALGVATLGGGAFIAEAQAVARLLRLPEAAVAGLGWLAAGLVAAYVVWTAVARRPLRLGPWHLAVPSLGIGLGQIAVAAGDLALVAGALHLLLPTGVGVSYPAFLGVYVVATLAGIASHVPGGLGVFEGAVVVMLPQVPAGGILGALLVFRVFYNLLPLVLAALILAVFEIIQRRRRAAGPAWLENLGPGLAAVLAFGAGTVLLLTGAVVRPGALPVWLAEPAETLSGAVGAALMAAAWGLARQVAAAHRLAMAALAAGAVLALARGPDWVVAVALAGIAAALVASAPLFPRAGPPADGGLPWGWTGAAAAVVAAACWLTLVADRGGGPAGLLLFSGHDAAARALRADLAAAAGLAAAAVASRLPEGRAHQRGRKRGTRRA